MKFPGMSPIFVPNLESKTSAIRAFEIGSRTTSSVAIGFISNIKYSMVIQFVLWKIFMEKCTSQIKLIVTSHHLCAVSDAVLILPSRISKLNTTAPNQRICGMVLAPNASNVLRRSTSSSLQQKYKRKEGTCTCLLTGSFISRDNHKVFLSAYWSTAMSLCLVQELWCSKSGWKPSFRGQEA